MIELRDQIRQIIETEPVAIFMKGTPEMPTCGNSPRALQALWNTGADRGRGHPPRSAALRARPHLPRRRPR